MKLQDIEVDTSYRGAAGQVRRVIRFNDAGTRLLYREMDRGRAKGSQVLKVGESRLVQAGSFAGWAQEKCES